MLDQWAAPFLRPEIKVLEVGCAGGDFARLIAERSIEVGAIDRSSKIILKAQKIKSSVNFIQADAVLLPFPDQYFDVVLAASLINVVDSPQLVISEMKRLSRTNGIVSILVPNKSFTDADAQRYGEDEQLSDISKVAFLTWHRLVRKMAVNALEECFKVCGLTDISTTYLLSGMVVVISAKAN